jgi:membrane protein DedA with SNARE-associated domain
MSIENLVQDYMQRAQPWIDNWGLWAIGAGILGETLLFAGVFIPGFSILVTAGLMSADGRLNPWATLVTALAGGVIGDQTAYLIGRLMGERLLARHRHALAKMRYALTHEGGYILLWYHYVSPLRIVMPYIAGSLRYPRLRWLLFDTLGLALWVAFGFGIGYVAHGPLKRFGDLGYVVVFGAILLMVLFSVWRLVKLLSGRLTAEQIFAEEAEMAGRVLERRGKQPSEPVQEPSGPPERQI